MTTPRGFTWSPDGALYAALAGSGGYTQATETAPTRQGIGPFLGGSTSAVVKIVDGCPVAVATGLPSTVDNVGEVLGAESVAFLGGQLSASDDGGGTVHGNPDAPAGIWKVNADGTVTLVADLAGPVLAAGCAPPRASGTTSARRAGGGPNARSAQCACVPATGRGSRQGTGRKAGEEARMSPRSLVLAAMVALALVVQGAARAQEATPSPDVPAVEECQIAPITPERLHAAFTNMATPPVMATYPSADEGTPADLQTTAGVTQTAREFVACLNARDLGRLLSLATDRYLPVLLSQFGDASEEAILAQMATPAAPYPPEEQTALVEVVDVRVLADGRVVAGVTGDNLGSDEGASTPLFFFVKVDDRWLIDDVLEDPSSATPTA